ncbi:caspase family protein [Zavarzinia sp. CC-PAN008]|uniref:caspase family protein n=1 Tax=Zavarzinia sp. CC-PAN008 TaxID=3243332 RepID=UPI003F7478B0
MKTRLLSILLAGLLLALGAPPAEAKRVALVIGNAAYADAPLRNPVNDATDMAAKLDRLGFDTITVTDTDKRALETAIADFGSRLEKGDTALVFYAGHGIQVNGRNYLIPVDATLDRENRVALETVDVERILEQLGFAEVDVSVVILDACRNNPFARSFRSAAARGLAPVGSAPRGTLIAYATAPDSVAADGDGRNGLYTHHLLQALDEPGLQVEEVMKRVRVGVYTDSGGAQVPWETASLTGSLVLNQRAPADADRTAGGAGDPAPRNACDDLASYVGDPQRIAPPVAGATLLANPEPAIRACQAAVERHPGEGRLHYMLGRSLHAANRLEEAATAYGRSIELGHLIGTDALAAMYMGGTGVPRDPARAAALFQAAADKGDYSAMGSLALRYDQGIGVPQDSAHAFALFARVAEATGAAMAYYMMGDMLQAGRGTAVDNARAMRMFKAAQDKAMPQAAVRLAAFHAIGIGVPRNLEEAARLLQAAADAGDPTGTLRLATYYLEGVGVPRDPVQAERLFRRAHAAGPAYQEDAAAGLARLGKVP